MDVDTGQWKYLVGTVNGLTVRADELAAQQGAAARSQRAVEGVLGELLHSTAAVLDRLEKRGGTIRQLAAVDGGRQPGRHAAPRGKLRLVE